MRYWFALLGISFIFVGGTATAQDYYRAEIFGGYSYLNIDTNGLTSRQSLNGWETSFTGSPIKWVGVEGDVSGYYKTYLGVKVTDYAFAGGPRINFGPAFVHTLFGMDSLTGSALGLSASQNSFAGVLGGGIEYPTSKRLAARVSVDYAFTHHNILGGTRVLQNNFRASVGIVFRFGPVGAKAKTTILLPRSSVARKRTAAAPGAVVIPELGVQVVSRGEYGAEVAVLAGSSPAQTAGINVGDIINSVDGTVIHTPADLSARLANRSPGTEVRIGYLLSGKWQSETAVVIGSK